MAATCRSKWSSGALTACPPAEEDWLHPFSVQRKRSASALLASFWGQCLWGAWSKRWPEGMAGLLIATKYLACCPLPNQLYLCRVAATCCAAMRFASTFIFFSSIFSSGFAHPDPAGAKRHLLWRGSGRNEVDALDAEQGTLRDQLAALRA